jgi:hypothetical protein
MKKLLGMSNNTALILCLISTAGLISTNIFFLVLRERIINLQDVEAFLNMFSVPVALVYIISGISHLAVIFALILQLNFFKRDNFLRAFLFFSGIISLLMLFGDFALVSDISKEYIFGLPDEFIILFFSQVLHFIFYVLMIILFVVTKKNIFIEKEKIVLKDDSIFINAQYIGILSGISGLILIITFSLLYLTVYELPSWAVDAGIIIISLIAVIPYLAIVMYWLIIKLKEGISEWYDEKQYQDIARAGLITLIISVIVMTAIFVGQYFINALSFFNGIWFPFYVFLVLALFSTYTLYFNKKVSS